MSAIDPSAKLDKALRFADMAVNAAAVPLPVNLMPSLVPQELPHDMPPADTAANDRPVDEAPANLLANHVEPITADQVTPEDALSNSLQAAVNAVHNSLNDTAPALPQEPALNADAAAPLAISSDPSMPDVNASAVSSDAVSFADAPHASTPHGAATAGSSGGDVAAPATADLAVQLPDASGAVPTLLHTVSDVVHTVTDVVQTLETTVENTVNTLTSTLGNLLGGEPDTGAVTIPSLGGVGLDAINGLLPPAAPEFAHNADPTMTSAHEMPIFDAIGVPEVLHAVQDLVHTPDSPQHLAGSGLI